MIFERKIKVIIIVEGIDRVGKTTLCNKLSKTLNIPIHKYNGIIPYKKMKNKQETDKTLGLIQLIEETKSDIIFDRCFLTDFVYGVLERGYNEKKAYKNMGLVFERLGSYSLIDNVFLVLVRSSNIGKSSKEDGRNLLAYSAMFDEACEIMLADKNLSNNICFTSVEYDGIDDLVNSLNVICEKEENNNGN